MDMRIKLPQAAISNGDLRPIEHMARPRGVPGEQVYGSETAGGAVRLSKITPDFETKMAAAEAIMRADTDMLRVFAN
jgi:hypothetical protein